MKQVVQNLKDGSVSVPELPAPVLQPGGILVQTICSVISPGTEGARTALARESLVGKARRRPDLVRQVVQSVRRDGLLSTLSKVKDRLDAPKAPGYSLAGRVLQVADDVTEFKVGDRVACAGEGFASHAEVVFVPRNLAALVPHDVAPEPAAFATLGAIALHGVRQTESRLGETVVVLGLGLIGQLAWQLLEASGIRAIGIDVAQEAVARAQSLGLKHAYLAENMTSDAIDRLTSGLGADGVLITAGSQDNEPIKLAGQLCRDRGRVVLLGAVKADIPRSPYYEKEIEVRMSRSYGPGRYDPQYEERGLDYPPAYVRWTESRNLAAFLELCQNGKVHLGSLVGKRYPLERADEAYALLISPSAPRGQALVLYTGEEFATSWPSDEFPRLTHHVAIPEGPSNSRVEAEGELGIGLIGAGNFARSVLLPQLGRALNTRLTGVSTAHPHTARHVAERFRFRYAATDPGHIIDDPDTHAIFVATRHDSHAELAQRALKNGKAVYVEKPLALDEPSLQAVLTAAESSNAVLAAGFNRPFAPLMKRLISSLPTGAPRQINLRVNAGPLPSGHWLRDPFLGGGRVVGEGCHFFDLALHLAGSEACSVRAAGSDDNFSAVIEFIDGSTATLLYTSDGDSSLAKERCEVYAGGVAAILDDYRKLHIYRDGKRKSTGSRHAGKGHVQLVNAFLSAARGETPSPTPVHSLAASHRLTFSAADQLQRT